MVWCGFDPLMEAGLLEYSKGVVSAISAKAKKNKLSIDKQISIENDQLYLLLSTLSNECDRLPAQSNERLRAEAFAGLVAFTRYIIPSTLDERDGTACLEDHARIRASELAQEIDKFDLAFESLPLAHSNLLKIGYAIKKFLETPAAVDSLQVK